MPNRILKESINESRALSEISFFANDLYKRLIVYADDYGRFNADYQIMLARLYPREAEIVKQSDIEDALIELSGVGKIAFYTSEPRKEVYGCFPNWSAHQRIRDSKTKCPDPQDTSINDYYLRRFIPISMKRKIIQRDNFKCQVCNKYISPIMDADVLIKMGTGLFHIDHIVPVAQGGRATMENLRLTCPKCNLTRNRKFTPEEILNFTICGNSPQPAASCENIPPNPIQYESESNPNTNTKTADKPQKHKYGEYQNVLLSDDDIAKLKAKWPDSYLQKIEQLSQGIEMKGYKYKNHYLALLKWNEKEASETNQRTYDMEAYEEMDFLDPFSESGGDG